MLAFACISPHPPLLLPHVGEPEEKKEVAPTIIALQKLGQKLARVKPDLVVISSPHQDWGLNVPLYFLTTNLEPNSYETQTIITGFESPQTHFESGKKIGQTFSDKRKVAWIASGDLSHRLAKEGPYGLHPSGPKFDRKLVELLEKKDVKEILSLDQEFVKSAGECGLRSICLMLGALAGSQTVWQPEILSYQAPFGVGYLVARLK
ncbi:MEMO1 family protein [Patescibacteria group bacterium]|nr:MEMO1 family protein [Patescibacteria group bacterium]